jgi:hypothetical protein
MRRLTKSRLPSRPLNGMSASLPPYDHWAVMKGRSIYASTVRTPARDADAQRVLKPAANVRKIGGLILKGHWRGFPIYTLSLEERATCPRSCRHWRSCFGNRMHLVDRIQAGADLEWRLVREVALLAIDHPDGFVVRLHLLGDFYSVSYVHLWRDLLARHPALHVWGFTARVDAHDPIAAALVALAGMVPQRFKMRFSNAQVGFPGARTISIEAAHHKPAGAVLCPEQIGRTESCSTCALCWGSKRDVAFLQH